MYNMYNGKQGNPAFAIYSSRIKERKYGYFVNFIGLHKVNLLSL